MKKINVIYDDDKDRKLIELVPNKVPVFINFINFNTVDGRKEAYKIKSHWAAKMNPFVEILNEDDTIDKVFYSEEINAAQQLITWFNECIN